jgi:tetratricopeptide (TPR) repeat protein
MASAIPFFLVHWIGINCRMWKPALLVAVLCLSSIAQAQTQQQAEELVQDAIQKQKAGDLEGAVKEYRQFLKVHPEATAIHSNLGAALAGLGRYEEAIPEYKLALKQSPALESARLNLALAYYKSGAIQDAATQLEKIHAKDKASQQATLLLGDCYLRMGREKEVIRVLEPEEKKRPEDLAIAYMLGMALLREKRVEEGQIRIDRILRNGDSAEAHFLLGMAKFEALEYAGAIADLTKAAEMNPNLPDLYSYLGQAQMESGDMTAARTSFEKELAQNPNNFEANVRLAVLLKQDGEYEHAQQLLARALLVRPGDPGALYQVGATYLSAGDLNRACATLEQVLKDSPQFLEAHVSLAQVYYRQKRKEDGDRERALVQKLKAEQDAKQSQSKGEAKSDPQP